MVERWQSMDALQARFREALATATPESLDINVYEIAGELELPA